MPVWTPQQQSAIDARNNTILVSAAAGSGKTAVLIERIIQLIREGASLERMLIVTFTRAAAGEMRQRLNKRLTKEMETQPEIMGRALDELENTSISTIHSFCQKVLKEYFHVVGIDPMVKPCDDQLKKTLFDEAWLEAFNALIEEGDADFMAVADVWSQQALQEMTEQMHTFLMSLPAPMNWLDVAVARMDDEPCEAQPWYHVLLTNAGLQLGGIADQLAMMEQLLQDPDMVENRRELVQMDRMSYERLRLATWTDPRSLLRALDEYEMPKAKPARNKTEAQDAWLKRFKAVRDKEAEIIKNVRETLTIDHEQFAADMANVSQLLRGFSLLVKKTHEVFLAKKAERHVIDFNDMEQFTMDLLCIPEYREQIQGDYDHIFVDECQDVSQVQDGILQAIHNEKNCMFMVGDVKQSIYRFRMADPMLFLNRMRTFKDDEDATFRRIFLQKNFRSRNNVLEGTNQVFRRVMRPAVTELRYDAEDELICGRETTDDPTVEIHLIDRGEDEKTDDVFNREAMVMIQRIRELLQQDYDNGKEVRRYEYRDMVILLSAAATNAPRLVEIMNREGVPVFYDGAEAYYSLPEIQSAKALLTVLDNPRNDIALLATLKMTPFSFTDEMLAMIRDAHRGAKTPFHVAFEQCCEGESELNIRCREVQKTLAEWRFLAEVMRLSDFVWHILVESGFYAACGALPKGELRQANLRMLFQRAVDFEQNGGESLTDFLMYTDQQKLADDQNTAKLMGEDENVVRIMTMHKSKGLEFPVVFCLRLASDMVHNSQGDLLMHSKLGVLLPYVNRELRVKRDTPIRESFRIQKEMDEKAERARLLYVAMTRAKEKLILMGENSERYAMLQQMTPGDYRVWSARSMMEWIMSCVDPQDVHKLSTEDAQAANPWEIRVWGADEVDAVDNAVDKGAFMAWLGRELWAPVGEMPAYWNAQEEPGKAQITKTSVSSLVRREVTHDPMPLTDGDEEPEHKREPEEITVPLRMSEISARPAFMEQRQLDGADIGTLTHRALMLMPLDQLRQADNIDQAVHGALHDMLGREIFTAQELMMISHRGIASLYRSELGMRLLNSRDVRREWNFNLYLKEQGMMLQGVIDCAFLEDDGWVIVDYKTDRIGDEDAFMERYAMQLEWYARALERISGTRVKEMWLYALSKRKAYLLPREKMG